MINKLKSIAMEDAKPDKLFLLEKLAIGFFVCSCLMILKVILAVIY